jgi:hypothetical protein
MVNKITTLVLVALIMAFGISGLVIADTTIAMQQAEAAPSIVG